MKKILISLLLITIFVKNVDAETYIGNHSISLTMRIEPKYSVKIPKQLDISNNETYFEFLICGDIYADQILQIDFDEETKIYSNDRYCSVYIFPEKTQFVSNELTNEYCPYGVTLKHDELKAGNYEGKLTMVISLIGGA